jgi:hypothetical protein
MVNVTIYSIHGSYGEFQSVQKVQIVKKNTRFEFNVSLDMVSNVGVVSSESDEKGAEICQSDA